MIRQPSLSLEKVVIQGSLQQLLKGLTKAQAPKQCWLYSSLLYNDGHKSRDV